MPSAMTRLAAGAVVPSACTALVMASVWGGEQQVVGEAPGAFESERGAAGGATGGGGALVIDGQAERPGVLLDGAG